MTSRPQYLRVRNWETFQHYKDRRPPWIKFHVLLLQDYDLQKLTPVAQLLYDRLLLLAAITDNNVPNDAAWIAGKLSLRVRDVTESLETLCKSGFLSVNDRKRPASKAIERRQHNAMPRTRSRQSTETEKERASNPSAVREGQKEQPPDLSTDHQATLPEPRLPRVAVEKGFGATGPGVPDTVVRVIP